MAEARLIILDGYNIVHRAPELRPGPDRTLRESREKLVNLLSWVLAGDARFLLVFDGAEGGGGKDHRDGRVDVCYSRPPEKADDLIRRLVEESIDKVERLTVVTSDLEVARHARAMGADVSLSDLFLASALGPLRNPEPGAPPEKPTSLTKKEIEEWAEIFRHGKPKADAADEGSA